MPSTHQQTSLNFQDSQGDHLPRVRIYNVKCHGRSKIVRVCCDKAARREALALAMAVGAFDEIYARVLIWTGRAAETFGPVSITPMDVAA